MTGKHVLCVRLRRHHCQLLESRCSKSHLWMLVFNAGLKLWFKWMDAARPLPFWLCATALSTADVRWCQIKVIYEKRHFSFGESVFTLAAKVVDYRFHCNVSKRSLSSSLSVLRWQFGFLSLSLLHLHLSYQPHLATPTSVPWTLPPASHQRLLCSFHGSVLPKASWIPPKSQNLFWCSPYSADKSACYFVL